MGEWVSERDLAIIGLKIKDSPETTNSTELAHAREIGLTTSVIQLKQLTDFSDLGVTATATHDNGDNTNTAAAQRKQKLNKSTTSNSSDDKCNKKFRTESFGFLFGF